MNIIDNYNLNINSANLTKLENTKKKYENEKTSKFSLNIENDKIVNNEKKRLREVSEDFEALMINQMLKEMRKTVQKSELINGGMAEQIFEDMLYDEYSKKELNGFKRVKIQKEQLHFQHSLKRLVNYG